MQAPKICFRQFASLWINPALEVVAPKLRTLELYPLDVVVHEKYGMTEPRLWEQLEKYYEKILRDLNTTVNVKGSVNAHGHCTACSACEGWGTVGSIQSLGCSMVR